MNSDCLVVHSSNGAICQLCRQLRPAIHIPTKVLGCYCERCCPDPGGTTGRIAAEAGRMKTVAPEHLRLAQAALETRDVLRSLVAQIDRVGSDPERQAAMLKTARAVALTHSDILRAALKDCGARRHRLSRDAGLLWAEKEPR